MLRYVAAVTLGVAVVWSGFDPVVCLVVIGVLLTAIADQREVADVRKAVGTARELITEHIALTGRVVDLTGKLAMTLNLHVLLHKLLDKKEGARGDADDSGA